MSCLYATCVSCYITVGNAYVMDNEYDELVVDMYRTRSHSVSRCVVAGM